MTRIDKPEEWELIDPAGEVAAIESSCVRAWSQINGYKPTVEHLLAYEEAGWRVVPAVVRHISGKGWV